MLLFDHRQQYRPPTHARITKALASPHLNRFWPPADEVIK
jgi:hypothetical protein